MPGKKRVERKEAARSVELTVGEKRVELNGFVEDVIEEVVVALVRSLGTEDPEAKIEVTISGAR